MYVSTKYMRDFIEQMNGFTFLINKWMHKWGTSHIKESQFSNRHEAALKTKHVL